jgi:membrane associated rhomboid family serine protease
MMVSMLSDRNYMRNDYNRSATSVVTWILCGLAAAFVLQLTSTRFIAGDPVNALLSLSPHAILTGRVWTLFSYALLSESPLYLLGNALCIYFVGRELVPLLGTRRFVALFAGAILAGAGMWLAVHFWRGTGAVLVGSSSAAVALFIVFACIYPEREITFLLFFILPVTLKPKIIAWVLIGFELLGLIYGELAGGTFDTGVPYSAHLGGMLAGWIFYRYFYIRNGWDRASGVSLSLPAWLRWKKAAGRSGDLKVNLQHRPDLRAEVDRILDKINSLGFGSLTDEEKKLLDEAKDILSRR